MNEQWSTVDRLRDGHVQQSRAFAEHNLADWHT